MKIVDDYTLVAGKAKAKAVWIVAGTYDMDEDGWVVYPDMDKCSLKITSMVGLTEREKRDVHQMVTLENLMNPNPAYYLIHSYTPTKMTVSDPAGIQSTFTKVEAKQLAKNIVN